ncbi:MAG TPA: hypothetical protein DCP75_14090 [Haliea salexigens]|uniref:DUF423 domain-containing protein n=1 Tax=Haliea salexigens TaxID=287487 RepID=A0A3C1KRJ9_9GAMM|nr:hypothetical protein [Haliea sp.]HAN28826.1 hypothetical protein [Haliea salexigens]HBX74019.1 hypothetical protein [Halieaceae bacterium]
MLAVLGAVAHEFAGGPMVLPPLQESDLQRDVIALHHFSWHVGSVAVLTMGGMFAFASKKHGSLELAVAATAMSAGFSLLAFGLSLIAYGELWGTPAPYVWSVITVVGAVGVWCHFKARSVI